MTLVRCFVCGQPGRLVAGRIRRSGPANGIVSLSDVLTVLAQVGTNCS